MWREQEESDTQESQEVRAQRWRAILQTEAEDKGMLFLKLKMTTASVCTRMHCSCLDSTVDLYIIAGRGDAAFHSDQGWANENPPGMPRWCDCWPHGQDPYHLQDKGEIHVAWDGEGCEGVGMFSRLYHISNISHPHYVLCPCHFYIECLLALSSHVYCMIILIMFIFSSQISKCDVCQHMNRKMTTGKPELHPIPVKAPWHQIGIDFVGPLSPESDDGSRYIFTASDYSQSG